MNPGHKKASPFQEGPLIAKRYDLESFLAFPENRDRLRNLNKRIKIYHGEDGWFAGGRNGQLWEYGIHTLGFTVGTGRMVERAIKAGFTISQRGDHEANFRLPWNENGVDRVIALLRLKRRTSSTRSSFLATGRCARKRARKAYA